MGSEGSSSLALSLGSSTAQVFQGQSSITVIANLTRSGSPGTVALTVSGLPQGATDQVQSPGTGPSGSIAFNAGTAAAGTYAVTIVASDGTLSATANLNLTVGASATIMGATQGTFSVAMSTSFQPAEWDDQFFTLNPSAPTALSNLEPHHIRLQAVSVGVPQGAAGTSSTAWDFATVDAITQPVLGVGDHSPEFQIAKAPPFMYANNDSSDSFLDLTFQQFAGYTQNLVRYYNAGGFMANGQLYVSPAYPAESVTWWGIYNEPNFNNNLTPEQYVTLFNTVVPAMQAIDPAIKIVGLELGDYLGEEEAWVPPFVSGVTAQVDVMATHFYSTCNQKDSDTEVFDSVSGFVTEVEGISSAMATNPALASVPVWVTENNVNADYDAGNGISACNGTPFVTDLRGSSAFFAAWRPYVFSQLGKAGIRALYHWDYGADPQYGEVDYNTGGLQLSYWVDYWLGRLFPASPGSNLLEYSSTDNAELEVLPVVNGDKSVVIMVANHAVNDPMTDNNGPGAPRSVLLDVSALGTFSSGSLLLIDAKTSAVGGPTAAPVTPAAQMTISFGGYGVQFLTLKP
jgi:Glycosyl hydrolase catalytic core